MRAGNWANRLGEGAFVERIKRFIRERQPVLIIGGLIFTFVVLFFGPNIFVTIKEGEAGVMFLRFFGGTVRDKIYGEGLHVVWPWDKLKVYNVRIQESRRTVEVLDNTGLQLRLNVSIRYHPDYIVLALLHQRVGPDYVDKVVIPEVEGVLRTTVGTLDAHGLYANEHEVLARIVNQSMSRTADKYIVIDNVIIRSIELPEPIQVAIQKKREEEQLAEAYVYRLLREEDEAKRKVVEAKGTKDANDIVSSSLSSNILKWRGIEATMALAGSTNAKVIVVGNGPQGLPIILGADK
jgi:regulator of protease activity HflC (stomatin/prohibitin superfamily)